MTIWFDADDLIEFFQTSARPTGIQRLSFEIYRAVWRQAGGSGEIGFCRRIQGRPGFSRIHFPALEAGILAAMAAGGALPAPVPAAVPAPGAVRRWLARHLAPQFRPPLGRLRRALRETLAALAALARACLPNPQRPALGRHRIGGHAFDLRQGPVVFAPGDWLVSLGATWTAPYDQAMLARHRAAGIGFALLVYDLIPELFPEWCDGTVARAYAAWLRQIVPRADALFAISACTAADLTRCLSAIGVDAPAPLVLPVGSSAPVAARPTSLPALYVLCVGTIEARKNHAALLRVWRRLLQTLPAAEVPLLVLAGKPGWLTADFMQQLQNAGWMEGKIRLIDSPSEPELAGLYQGCLFSVFPSFYEGWGLPVTESLAHGKTAAASRSAAIQEAGGSFCAYFDPDDINDMFDVIHKLITNPTQREALEARIAAGFRPATWDETAAKLLAALGLEDEGLWPAALQSIG